MERIQNCFICNITVGVSARNCVNIFEDKNSLQGKKKLPELIGEIIGKTLTESSLVTHIICKKCQRACIEYDGIKRRLEVISTEIQDNYNKTSQLQKNNNVNTIIKKETKRLVLPKSKLQPLPANYVIDVEKLAAVSKSNIILNSANVANQNFVIDVDKYTGAKSNDTNEIASLFKISPTAPKTSVNLVKSTVTSVSDPLKITTSDISLILSPEKSRNSTKTVPTSLQNTTTKNPVLSFNVDLLPKDFLASNDKDEAMKKEIIDLDNNTSTENNDDNDLRNNDDNDTENNDEHPMEIDEDCSLVVPGTTDDDGKLIFEVENTKSKTSNFLDLNLLLSPDDQDQNNDRNGKFVLDKLQILNDNDDDDDEDGDEQTIVMKNSEGTTIIRMAAGQKVVYDGENFALVPDGQPDQDSQDSNDESQIELQVSGDEETANAIIAAAREQGGAFIKVESGEMFRVQSVQSKVDTEETLRQIQSIVEVENGHYKCQLCTKTDKEQFVGDAEGTMQHLKSVHNARVYICQICGHVMRRRLEYSTHLEEHTGQRGSPRAGRLHACAACGRRYNSRTLLAAHLNTHSGARPHACLRCDKSFASKYTLQAHEKTHLDRPRPYKCEMCGKAFLTLQNLTQHEKTHSNVKEFVCKICDKAFSTQHNLEVHGVIHTGRKPFFCSVCNKNFARRAEVKDHMRIHTGERPFACDVCGATFTQRSNLLSHKRATHMEDRRYHCATCPKKFKRRRLLDYHIKAAHTGERPLKCDVCRATFVYPEHYKKHLKIHSGEKPFACEVCGKTFNSRDNRNTHRFVHSDKKPYECLSCGAGYMRKQLLYAHMNSTGHVAESIVVNQPRVIKATENGILTPLVDVNGIEIKTDKFSNAIFETTEELELDENDIHSVETTIQGLVQGSNEATFYTLDNLENIIEAGEDDGKLVDHRQIITTDAKGDTMRLIQVQLPDGKTGWVAIDQ